jgi:hypothetical protein
VFVRLVVRRAKALMTSVDSASMMTITLRVGKSITPIVLTAITFVVGALKDTLKKMDDLQLVRTSEGGGQCATASRGVRTKV